MENNSNLEIEKFVNLSIQEQFKKTFKDYFVKFFHSEKRNISIYEKHH